MHYLKFAAKYQGLFLPKKVNSMNHLACRSAISNNYILVRNNIHEYSLSGEIFIHLLFCKNYHILRKYCFIYNYESPILMFNGN